MMMMMMMMMGVSYVTVSRRQSTSKLDACTTATLAHRQVTVIDCQRRLPAVGSV